MTEEEAKTKMCPQTFAIPEIRAPDGTGFLESGPFACIGSDCMAWCWDDDLQLEYRRKGEPAPKGDGWTLDTPNAELRTYRRRLPNGHCGLVCGRR